MFGQQIVAASELQHHDCDVDEKYFPIPRLKSADVHPTEDIEGDELRDLFFQTTTDKGHPDKVMCLCIVAKPIIRPEWTGEADKWLSNGLIAIFRATVTKTDCNGKKRRNPDGSIVMESRLNSASGRMRKEPVYDVEPNTPKEIDAIMDGELYFRMMVERGGLQMTAEYMAAAAAEGSGFADATGRCTMQEDGAPGHGYANRAKNAVDGMPGRATAWHERMEAFANALGIDIFKQSAKTPEGNALDLGIWRHLSYRVMCRYEEFLPRFETKPALLDKLFEVIEEEFWLMDPEKLYTIFEHKVDIAKQIVHIGGGKILKEVHGGARKRTQIALAAKKAGATAADLAAFELMQDVLAEEMVAVAAVVPPVVPVVVPAVPAAVVPACYAW